MIESQHENMSLDDPHEVIDKMRTFAGQLGCDALVIFAGNDATVVGGGSNSTISQTLKGYRGSCLVYTAQPPRHLPNPVLARPTTCMPNATQLCYGPGGCRGAQRCAEDGKSFTLCDCGPAQHPGTVSSTTTQ
jgi:hypothetical protein